ncbi:hypothetical protein ACFX13_023325 [Malus domestica]
MLPVTIEGRFFLHFDTYFKTYLSCRNDLLLSDKILEDDSPFPKHAVLQISRVMQTILENCNNKSSFDGLKHFELLLASMDPDLLASTDLKVFIAALETLSALVKINPSKMHVSGKMIGCGTVNNYLLSLAQKECDGKRMDMANIIERETKFFWFCSD